MNPWLYSLRVAAMVVCVVPLALASPIAVAQEVVPPLYPMPYASESTVPERYRVDSLEPPRTIAPTTPIQDVPDDVAVAVADPHEAVVDHARTVDGSVDLGFADRSDASVARLIGALSASVVRDVELRLRVPMLVANVRLTRNDTLPPSDASTFRFGNITLGAEHALRVEDTLVRYGADFVFPSAIGADEGDDQNPTLERQLSTRAYDLAAAIDGMRDAWLFRQNTLGFVAHGALQSTSKLWLLAGEVDFAVVMPIGDELNGEVLLQTEVIAGRRVGPVTFAVRGSVVLLAAVGRTIPSVSPLVAFTDGADHVWSLRATFAANQSAHDVAPWGMSLAFGGDLP